MLTQTPGGGELSDFINRNYNSVDVFFGYEQIQIQIEITG